MHHRKLILISILLISSISLVSASEAELTIFPGESSAEINSFTSYEITVENIGNVDDVYTLTSEADQVTIAPEQVEVAPGQQERVHAWYNPDETQDAGTYTFDITATSRATGETYSTEGVVNVLTDHDVQLTVEQPSPTVCLGEDAEYEILVTNEGIQTEEFALSSGLGQLSHETVELEEGETQVVTLTVSSEEAVEQEFDVVVSSTTSYASDGQTLEFEAEVCYDSEISIEPESQQAPAFTETEYEVTLSNTGTQADEFTLSTDRGELEQDNITVEGESTGTVNLTYTPEEIGQHEIEVTAEGISQSSATATAEVINPMNFEMEFDSESVNICENEEAVYELDITNTGEVTEDYSLETSRGNLSATEGTLSSGQSGSVTLTVDTEELETGETYEVEVIGTALTFGEPVKSEMAEFTVENCWDLELNVVPNVMSAGENRSVVYEVHLENTGTRENSYQLSHEGPEWISIRPEEVTVASGDMDTAYMYAGIPFEKEGEARINVTAEGEQVTRTETATLVIDGDVEDAIQNGEDERDWMTGRFSETASRLSEMVSETTDLQKVVVSLVAGLAITLGLLYGGL